MRRYETIFITHPEVSEEDFSALQVKINSILAGFKGDLIKLDDWGLKKLTYEIRKNSRGHFFLMDYMAGTDLVRELERNLRLNDHVLRFQTIRIGDLLSPEALKALKDSAGAEKASKGGERPAPPGGDKGPEAAQPEAQLEAQPEGGGGEAK